MDASNTLQEINTALTNLIADREQLQAKLGYAISTISELKTQNEQLELLLANAQFHLKTLLHSDRQAQRLKACSKTSCMKGTWISNPETTPFLTPAELAWNKGQAQNALTLLTQILNEQGITASKRANAELLSSVILRTSGQFERAHTHALNSIRIAERAQLYDLRCKAQFHRGLCFMHELRYDQAVWCFVRAFYTPGYEELVKANMEIAVQNLLKLSSDDPKRKFLSEDELLRLLSFVGQ